MNGLDISVDVPTSFLAGSSLFLIECEAAASGVLLVVRKGLTRGMLILWLCPNLLFINISHLFVCAKTIVY